MSGPGQTNEEGNTMNDDTDPKTCSEHGDVLIWEPGGDDMPTVYGRWYCPSCQRRLMAALDASRARGIKQGRDEQPTVSAGDVERVAERLHAEHVREFEWMKGDRLFDEAGARLHSMGHDARRQPMSGLTEQERLELLATEGTTWGDVFAAVERIVAERERAAQVRALRDAVDDWGRDSPVTRWLRDRADRLEEGKS